MMRETFTDGEHVALRRQKVWFILSIALFAYLLAHFLLGRIQVISSDSSFYTVAALNILEGRGYTKVNGGFIGFRSPAFSSFIAVLFRIFGVSYDTAYLSSKIPIVFISGILVWLGFVLGRRLEGVIAALLVVSSQWVVGYSLWSILIDPLQTMFVLLYIVVLSKAFMSDDLVCFGVAALTLATAVTIRENALAGVALPIIFLLARKKYRTRSGYAGAAMIVCLPVAAYAAWYVYTLQQGIGSWPIEQLFAGKPLISKETAQSSGWAVNLFAFNLDPIWYFRRFHPFYRILPFIGFMYFVFMLAHSLLNKNDRSADRYLLLVSSYILFVFATLYVGFRQYWMEERYLLPGVILSYYAVGELAARGADSFRRGKKNAVTFAVACLVAIFLLYHGRMYLEMFGYKQIPLQQTVKRMFFSEYDVQRRMDDIARTADGKTVGRQNAQTAANWIAQNLGDAKLVNVTEPDSARIFYFFNNGRFSIQTSLDGGVKENFILFFGKDYETKAALVGRVPQIQDMKLVCTFSERQIDPITIFKVIWKQ